MNDIYNHKRRKLVLPGIRTLLKEKGDEETVAENSTVSFLQISKYISGTISSFVPHKNIKAASGLTCARNDDIKKLCPNVEPVAMFLYNNGISV